MTWNNAKTIAEWTGAEYKRYCISFRAQVPDGGICEETDGCVLREAGICKASNMFPHLWNLSGLSEKEINLAKAVDGAKYITRSDGFVTLWTEKPQKDSGGVYDASDDKRAGMMSGNLFPSVKSGQIVFLGDAYPPVMSLEGIGDEK